jgi:hypothetical protein
MSFFALLDLLAPSFSAHQTVRNGNERKKGDLEGGDIMTIEACPVESSSENDVSVSRERSVGRSRYLSSELLCFA